MLSEDFDEIEDVTRIMRAGIGISIAREDRVFREESLVLADDNLFEIFDLTFVSGSPETALARPTNIVLTERAAERYFGSEDPIGQTLLFMGQMDVTVAAENV